MGDFRQGKTGADIVLPVPEGTVVKSMSGELLADLTGVGARFVVAEGGRGGLGNAALASKARKAPGFALLGEPGEERDVILELEVRRGCRPRRFSFGGQVFADRRPQFGAPEDR